MFELPPIRTKLARNTTNNKYTINLNSKNDPPNKEPDFYAYYPIVGPPYTGPTPKNLSPFGPFGRQELKSG